MTDTKKLRRQVAWACFEPYLSEAELLKAIQILERSFQTDSISNLIAYVSKVCSDFGIDTQVRKALYSQFHQKMTEKTDLPIDPLELMHPRPTFKTNPIILKPALTEAQQPESVPSAPTIELPVHTAVFNHFMHQLITYLPDKAELFLTLKESTGNTKLVPKEIAGHFEQWANNPIDFNWTNGLEEKTLANLVHIVYTALCEILGPIAADDSFHKAMAVCEQKPEARKFPPSRFL